MQFGKAALVDVEVSLLRKPSTSAREGPSTPTAQQSDPLLDLWNAKNTQQQKQEKVELIRRALTSSTTVSFYPGDRFNLSVDGSSSVGVSLRRVENTTSTEVINVAESLSLWRLRICDVSCPRRGVRFGQAPAAPPSPAIPSVGATTPPPKIRSAGGEVESEYVSGSGATIAAGGGGTYDLGFNPFHPQGDDGGFFDSSSSDGEEEPGGNLAAHTSGGSRPGGGRRGRRGPVGSRQAGGATGPPSVRGEVGNIFFYTNSKQEAEEEGLGNGGDEDDGGEGSSNFTACTVLSLPNVQTEGIWESLHLSTAPPKTTPPPANSIGSPGRSQVSTSAVVGGVGSGSVKSKLLHYTSTALRLAQLSVDPNLVSFNKLILLHGPPGTGKTSVAKALAHKMAIRVKNNNLNTSSSSSTATSPSLALSYRQVELVEINAHSLFSRWFSESGKQVLQLFTKIKDLLEDKRCLVFILIDEVESLAASRSGAMSRGNEPSDAIRVVNSLLTQLDSLKIYPNVVMVATSNITEAIDVAFIDRADLKLYLGPPPLEAKIDILMSSVVELIQKKVLGDLDSLISAARSGGGQESTPGRARASSFGEVVLNTNPTAPTPEASSPREEEEREGEEQPSASTLSAPASSPLPWIEKMSILRFLLKESLRAEPASTTSVAAVGQQPHHLGCVQTAVTMYQQQRQGRRGGGGTNSGPRRSPPTSSSSSPGAIQQTPPPRDPMPGLTGRALRKLPLLALSLCSSSGVHQGGGLPHSADGGLFSLAVFLECLNAALRQELTARAKMQEE